MFCYDAVTFFLLIYFIVSFYQGCSLFSKIISKYDDSLAWMKMICPFLTDKDGGSFASACKALHCDRYFILLHSHRHTFIGGVKSLHFYLHIELERADAVAHAQTNKIKDIWLTWVSRKVKRHWNNK